MGLANCRKCKKLFNKLSRDICPDCMKAEEGELSKVQAYLREHPLSSVFEIEEGCGVAASLVMQFAREKRINLVRLEENKVTCKFCGREIEAGSMCKLCQMKFVGEGGSGASAGGPPAQKRIFTDRRGEATDSLIKDRFQRK